MIHRADQAGKKILTGHVVENWEGRRAVAKYVKGALELVDEEGVRLKTPVMIIGSKKDIHLVEPRPRPYAKPRWYSGMR